MIEGTTPEWACELLAEYAQYVNPDHAIVEIGVFKGRTLCYMAQGAKAGRGATVYGIDPWQSLPGNGKHKTTIEKAQEVVDRCAPTNTILIEGFSTDVAEWWDKPVGMMYIDGNHNYEPVLADIHAWSKHVKTGAYIIFDDYENTHPGVMRAVDKAVKAGTLTALFLVGGRIAVTQKAVIVG